MATKAKSTTKKPFKMPAGHLITREVCEMFGVKPMTIFLWRRGTPTRTPMPFHSHPKGDRHLVTFKPAEIKKWAKANGVSLAS